jgi:hypothetical protein
LSSNGIDYTSTPTPPSSPSKVKMQSQILAIIVAAGAHMPQLDAGYLIQGDGQSGEHIRSGHDSI